MKNPDRVAMTMAVMVALAIIPFASVAQPPSGTATSPGTPVTAGMSLTGIPAVQLNYRGQRLALITREGGKVVLTVESVDGGHAQPVAIPGGCEPTAIRWARRWNKLAVLTQCATDVAHPQPTGAVWVVDVQAGKPPRKLVNFNGTGAQIQWRSDGKVVAFRFTPSALAGSNQRYASMIMAGQIDGGKFGSVLPAALDVHDFYISPFGGGVLFTATPAASPEAPPALYEASASQVTRLFDPATATGALHDLRIGRLRFSPTGGGRPMPVFFLGRSASASQPGADLYMKLASDKSPIVNLTAEQSVKPGWFEPSGLTAVATRVADGSTELIGYVALGNGTGLRRSNSLCTIPGTITDGSGPGSMSTNGGRYAYFEYPKSGGTLTLNVGPWRVGMACRPRWSRPVGQAMASN